MVVAPVDLDCDPLWSQDDVGVADPAVDEDLVVVEVEVEKERLQLVGDADLQGGPQGLHAQRASPPPGSVRAGCGPLVGWVLAAAPPHLLGGRGDDVVGGEGQVLRRVPLQPEDGVGGHRVRDRRLLPGARRASVSLRAADDHGPPLVVRASVARPPGVRTGASGDLGRRQRAVAGRVPLGCDLREQRGEAVGGRRLAAGTCWAPGEPPGERS